MGLLDNHPETQQKTRTALACTLVACTGAFLGELLTIHVPALAAAATATTSLPLTALGAATAAAIVPVSRTLSALKLRREVSQKRVARAKDANPAYEALAVAAFRLNRKAMELELERSERDATALDRKVALRAAEAAETEAREWFEALEETQRELPSDDAVARAKAALEAAAGRADRLRAQVQSDHLSMLEMKAVARSVKAEAVEARVRARDARPGHFFAP